MAESPDEVIAGVFDRAAPTYDHVGVDFFGPIAERLVAELEPMPGDRALDVGCGRGAVLFRLAEAVAPGGTTLGLDLSAGMVAATTKEVEERSLDAIAVRQGDAVLPDDLGTFDIVASSLVVFFLSDPGAALRSWANHLVVGGRVGISTFGQYNDEWRAVDGIFLAYRPPEVADPRATTAGSPFATDAGVEHLLTGAGFAEVRTVTTVVEVRFADPQQWYDWSWSVGQRGMWERVPEADRDGLRDRAFAQLEHCRDDAGRIGFDQTVRFTLGRRAV